MKTATICIEEIQTYCVLGVEDSERSEKQKILITLSLELDITDAVKTDDINKTTNYHALSDKIGLQVAKSEFHLLESLAEFILNLCLKEPYILKATARIEKPFILPYSKGVFIEMTKEHDKKE